MKFPYQKIDQITEDITPGFYRIDHAAYHAGPGISSSKAKNALVSYDKFRAPSTNSAAMTFGRAFHMAILEPHLYGDLPCPPGGSGTKAYKAYVDSGQDAVAEDDLPTIAGMVNAIKEHPEYGTLKILGADPEIMAVTRCKETGLLIKCKADLFGSSIVDFKSTREGVTPHEFMHTVVNFGYHISAAFYSDIIASITGVRSPFIMVPVTKSEPYECEFYEVPDAVLDHGRQLYKAALKRIQIWNELGDKRIAKEKRLRVLPATTRLAYSTLETLQTLEDLYK